MISLEIRIARRLCASSSIVRLPPKRSFSSLPPISSTSSSSSTAPCSEKPRPLIALGIETSCDDTCAAVVTSDRRILSEVLRTQHHLHEPMGGIVPKLAHHAHMRNLPAVVQEAIQKADLGERGIQAIDLIAVTRGPGLAHSLGVGLNAAKTLAAALNKPLIGVHHMEAHALTARLTSQDPHLLTDQSSDNKVAAAAEPSSAPSHWTRADHNKRLAGSDPYPAFPFLTLLVSGGHTMLLIAHSVDRYTTLATTVDDSIGDAFDKSARELQIPWLAGRAGGPGASLEEFAKGSKNPERYLDQLPIPMSLRNNKREMKFSFAGLKAAVTRIVKQETQEAELAGAARGLHPNEIEFMDIERRRDLAAGFQHCAVTHLGQKVAQGLEHCREQGLDISSLVISGGVGRNATVRSTMEQVCAAPMRQEKKSSHQQKQKQKQQQQQPTLPKKVIQVICPPPKLCTDNAVMIAWTGIERFQLGLVDPYDIDIVPKWPLDMLGTGVVPE
ncbi:N6-L-threonylcarbamoyladenine synthase [Entomortierella parvispora]|uniref:N(6)-L-threonylcarbamoyladenine synthase n=1 Tax=Entomortierella parvispora TaxID=205924 RepID=A0A9P3HJ15_9FUNG|nr:N6-L-threonylcarbamoyladenine synthase [Entomortierella parvispora]